ncbi:hypothetical protein EWM64_g217 [Hericium alpestre]|uniref:Glutathione transferase n=1 Tax=Hericium alpestre TaxID=135208 RepID=A0A4Z0ABX0_9AGAM|nr:hypothetical protein EWM64_g217 [Hericium alpestre]
MDSCETAPLVLYTARAPNGVKISIHLEELKAVYGGPQYDAVDLNLRNKTKKEPWFIEINPNGRIPALTDRSRGGLNIFESGTITLYLAQHYDKEHWFSFDPVKEPDEYIDMVQWTFFANTEVGPFQGQPHWFFILADEDVPYAKNRYLNEARHLYSVLDSRLKDRDYLAGSGRGKYTLADINVFPWVDRHALVPVDKTPDEWPNLKAWLERLRARPALQLGNVVPPEQKK